MVTSGPRRSLLCLDCTCCYSGLGRIAGHEAPHRAIWEVGARRASNVLPWPYGADPLRAHPWARSVLGIVTAVVPNRLVLGVPVRCFPKCAVKGDSCGIWRVWKCACLQPRFRCKNPLCTHKSVWPRARDSRKARKYSPTPPGVTVTLSLSSGTGAGAGSGVGVTCTPRGQIVAPTTTGALVENHRIGVLLHARNIPSAW